MAFAAKAPAASCSTVARQTRSVKVARTSTIMKVAAVEKVCSGACEIRSKQHIPTGLSIWWCLFLPSAVAGLTSDYVDVLHVCIIESRDPRHVHPRSIKHISTAADPPAHLLLPCGPTCYMRVLPHLHCCCSMSSRPFVATPAHQLD